MFLIVGYYHYFCNMKKIEMYNSGVEIPYIYRDENIALVDDLSIVKNINDSVFLEGYLVVLILKGHAQVSMSDRQYMFSSGDLFFCSPKSILNNIMMSMDLEIKAVFVTPSFAQQIVQMANLDFSLYMLGMQSEIMRLTEDEISVVTQYFTMLSYKYRAPETPFKNYSVSALLSSMMYSFSDLLTAHDISVQNTSYTSANQIFKRFIHLLKSPDCNLHLVKDFASQLNISPKYFSSICHMITGKSASTLINEAKINDASQLLRNPNLTIKQISVRLGFANASHFGTYFRRQTGMSPQHFRKLKN